MNFEDYEYHTKNYKWAEEADQLEWKTFMVGQAPYTSSQLDDEIADLFVEDQSEAESAGALVAVAGESIQDRVSRKLREATDESSRADERRDDLTMGMRAEIERRALALGDAYPFQLLEGSLAYIDQRTKARKIYMQCLRTSVAPEANDRDSFESLVADALKAYLGRSRAGAEVFGWRGLVEVDQPSRISGKFRALSATTGEWHWNPQVGFPEDPNPSVVKDLGLDAVAWLPIGDSREGQIFILAQCATGRTNWDTKLEDVTWARLENWIRPVPKGWTIRCFAIPFHLPNRARWSEVSKRGGLFLDRIRLTLLLKG